jgi:hypothetical protein
MIVDLMDPTNYNDNHYKDRFLANMYRIVSDAQLMMLINREGRQLIDIKTHCNN